MNVNYSYDFSKKLRPMRAMHGVGQPPISGQDYSMFDYLSDAGIPYSRMHDVGGAFGGNLFIDIHNVFRDFDADETKPENYDFTFTDLMLAELHKRGVQIIYRLGETIENYHYIKAYRIFPPKDPAKWARICEHIIRHYNEGWADGLHLGIRDWEIWNEPDNGRDDTENQMWHGTPEQFFELYTVTAKHLKKVFGDTIRVGGFATCGFRHIFTKPEKFGVTAEFSDDPSYASERAQNFMRWFEMFFAHIKKENAPIDFFSWHSYLTTERTVICANYVDKRLAELGYAGLPTQCNEWNNVTEDRCDHAIAYKIAVRLRGTPMASAMTLGMMCAMQTNTNTEIMCYYDARCAVSSYAAMFDPMTEKPFKLYYAFPAFNELYRLGTEVAFEGGARHVYSLAATDGEKRAVLVVNATEEDAVVSTNLSGMTNAYLLDETHDLDAAPMNPTKFTLPAGTFVLLTDYEISFRHR